MTELLTAAQMRAIEQAAIDAGEVTGLELMERAGQGVVDAILAWRPELATAPHRAVILCGPGNNGGDGFVIARLLHERGWDVEVFLCGSIDRLHGDAATNAERWCNIGPVSPTEKFDAFAPADHSPDIVVDALFGTGLTRGLEGDALAIADLCLHRQGLFAQAPVIAVDTPSGLCANSGRALGEEILFLAALTVVPHGPKIGHFTAIGPEACGELAIVNIGLAPSEDVEISLVDTSRDDAEEDLRKEQYGHKYREGHAIVLSGGVGRGGAARLAARGALRVGAGLVTMGCPPAAVIENAGRLDAIMLTPLADAEALTAEIAARKVRAVCVGPGFGTGQRLRAFVAAVLAHREVEPQPTGGLGVVLDADALTEFREDPEALFAQLHERCVLTPHEGEFGRLFPDILEKLKAPALRGPAYSKVDATREAAARAGCVVLFKGADTVIAAPDGRCSINAAVYERAAPWLATAGSGDVLAGFITGLLARGFGPMQAAETGAWLHVECARQFGPGLIAEDLPEQLPAVFRDLGL